MFFDQRWDMVVDGSGVPHIIVSGHYPNSPIGAPCVEGGGCTPVDIVPDGSGWAVTPISASVGHPDAIVTDAGGLEMTLNDDNSVWYVEKVGDDWVTQSVVTMNGTSSLIVGPDGPIVVYAPSNGSALKRADRSGSTWTSSTVLTGRIPVPAAQADAAGTPHIAYSLANTTDPMAPTQDAYVRAPDAAPPTRSGCRACALDPARPSGRPSRSASSWTAVDAQSGIDHFRVQQRNWVAVHGLRFIDAGHGLGGRSLTAAILDYRVSGYDKAGHSTPWMQGPSVKFTTYQETSSYLKYAGTWSSSSISTASGGKTKFSTSLTAKATVTFTGDEFALDRPEVIDAGLSQVTIDGVYVGEVNLYRSSTQAKTSCTRSAGSRPGPRSRSTTCGRQGTHASTSTRSSSGADVAPHAHVLADPEAAGQEPDDRRSSASATSSGMISGRSMVTVRPPWRILPPSAARTFFAHWVDSPNGIGMR